MQHDFAWRMTSMIEDFLGVYALVKEFF